MLASLLMGIMRGDKAPKTLVRWRAWEQAREPELSHLDLVALQGRTRAQAPCLAPTRENGQGRGRECAALSGQHRT